MTRRGTGVWICQECDFKGSSSPAHGFVVLDGDPSHPSGVLDMMIRAGWDKVCDGVREAGRRMIENPDEVVQFLRGLADSLDKRKEYFSRGKQGEGENVETRP
jgi:hypothetical protein